MKNLKSILTLSVSALLLFNSCKKTDSSTTAPPAPQNPSISLVGGPGYASSDYTTSVGSAPITVKAISMSNTTSNSKLDNVYMSITSNNTVISSHTTTFTTSVTSHVDTVIIPTTTAGTSRVEFKVTDKAGKSSTVGINITVTGASPAVTPIGSGSPIVLGGAADPNPSHINLLTGATYSAATANANASSIDMAYNKTKVYSPSDALETNSTIHASGKITKLDVYTAKAYTAVTDADINAYVPTGATNVTLANGTVIMFITNTGKKGVFQVTAFNGSATSTTSDNISIVGKVQQ